jgi:hypothetical protein
MEKIMQCKECERLKASLRAVVAALVNGCYDSALLLARVGMYGGDVKNPLDCADPKRHRNQRHSPDDEGQTGQPL